MDKKGRAVHRKLNFSVSKKPKGIIASEQKYLYVSYVNYQRTTYHNALNAEAKQVRNTCNAHIPCKKS